ncbi:MAG: OmpA family protein [Pseudomonadota bacterium]
MRFSPLLALAPLLAAGAHAQEPATTLFESVFPGATVSQEAEVAYDETTFYPGPFVAKFEAGERLVIEGAARMVTYQAPEGRSTLELYRAYEREIAGLGFTPIFECAGLEACGGNIGYMINREGRGQGRVRMGDDLRYGLFDRTAGETREVVHVLAMSPGTGRTDLYLELATTDAVETGLEPLTASEIGSALDATGTAAIYGLEFATDSADLLPASEPVLAEMAAFLKERAGTPMLLVGHTDNQGDLAYNMGLSGRRAEAVRQALVQRFGIDAGQLETHGVGFLAPVAPNESEDGRARNRRVELVLR